MGITVGPYTTYEGFVLPTMYLSIESFRLVKTLSNDLFGCVFTVGAYQSREALHAGASSIRIPQSLANCEGFINSADFVKQSMYGTAYDQVKKTWLAAGYPSINVGEDDQVTPTTFSYDASGYNFLGFNSHGLNRLGYNAQGFNVEGYNAQGYTASGFNAEGYSPQGFNAQGLNAEGYDFYGFNVMGYNKDGYNRQGFNAEGYNRQGFNASGVNADGTTMYEFMSTSTSSMSSIS